MSTLKKLTNKVSRAYSLALIWGMTRLYRKTYSNILNAQKSKFTPNKFRESEKRWVEKWSALSKNPHRDSFRLFSMYIGDDVNIVPEDICASYIQPILNPIEYRAYYQDKNAFELILPSSFLPNALLRSINKAIYLHDYTPADITLTMNVLKEAVGGNNIVFLKPSVDSSSGQGVMCFVKNEGGDFIEKKTGAKLSPEFIMSYQEQNKDFILQEGLSQSAYISQFCSSSINTLRVATYRSVKDNKSHVCRIIMRIGKEGSYVDNAHAGGLFIGVDMAGRLAKYACDQYGNKYTSFNGVDFANNDFVIPDFEKVIKFACEVGDKILHHRLVAQDICITADGTPKLVEFNVRAFSVWLFQFAIGPAFGDYTDEIIELCKNQIKTVNKVIVEPF